jgi:hypothetical protein
MKASSSKPTNQLGLYGKLLKWIAEAELKPGHKSVLLSLSSFASSKNGDLVWPGQEKIAERASLSRRRVNSIVADLSDAGYIEIEKRQSSRGYRRPNQYRLKIGFRPEPKNEKAAEISHDEASKEKSLTLTPSNITHEGNNKKVTTLENKVDGIDACNSPAASCNSDSIGNEFSGGEKSNFDEDYCWTSKDTAAANAMVWYDLYAPFVYGRKIVREVGPKRVPIKDYEEQALCIEASKLASEYSNAALSSSRARVAFYYRCGRLFFPKARKFAGNHRLPNSDSKYLNRIFDELGPVGCYAIARAMAEWRFQPDKFPRTNPDISFMLQNIDLIEHNWNAALSKVDIPNEEWAVSFLAERLLPERREEILDYYAQRQ